PPGRCCDQQSAHVMRSSCPEAAGLILRAALALWASAADTATPAHCRDGTRGISPGPSAQGPREVLHWQAQEPLHVLCRSAPPVLPHLPKKRWASIAMKMLSTIKPVIASPAATQAC